jgi:glycosyltransferase involved in cell wall biosynthesis
MSARRGRLSIPSSPDTLLVVPPLELEVIADFLEEHWPSMDLTAEQLAVAAGRMPGVRVRFRRPPLWRFSASNRAVGALERAVGRFLQYPADLAWAARFRGCFHVADHSYAHVVRALPQERTGVYCHDLDAFGALLPEVDSPPARRAMARWTLGGMQRAAVVFHSTQVVKRRICDLGWIPRVRLVHAPYGVSPEFSPTPTSWDELVRRTAPSRYLLHVGSLIPRKNPEGLLHIFARLRAADPTLHLVQVGGQFAPETQVLAQRLGVTSFIVQRRDLGRPELAALYRCARLVLLPSLSEGFGLPVIESQACGAVPLVTDLEVLREVGGDAANYVLPGDFDAWDRLGSEKLATPSGPDARALANAANFTWEKHAERVVTAYRAVLSQ